MKNVEIAFFSQR